MVTRKEMESCYPILETRRHMAYTELHLPKRQEINISSYGKSFAPTSMIDEPLRIFFIRVYDEDFEAYRFVLDKTKHIIVNTL
jgi:hypothetical protein